MSKKDPMKPIPPRGFPEAHVHTGKTLDDKIKKWRKNHPDWGIIKKDAQLEIWAEAPPIMMCSAQVKELFANSEYDKIKRLQKICRKDFEGIDKTIRKEKKEAFHIIKNATPKFYVAYDADASVWIYCHKTEQEEITNDVGELATKVTSVCQLGRYSVTTGIVGTIEYTFKYTTPGLVIDSCVLAGKVVKLMLAAWKKYPTTDLVLQCFVDRMIVTDSDSNCVRNFVRQMATFSELNCLVSSIFSLAFLALAYVWKWTWKKYSVKFCIFNWSTEHNLFLTAPHKDNADLERIELKINNPSEIWIPKVSPLLPPAFRPRKPIDSFCHYDTFFVTNDDTFIEGCGFALKVELDQRGSKRGFVYAFNCSRFKRNRQKASENLNDCESLEEYYEESDNWNETPLKFSIQTEGIPITISSDTLCCSSNYFPIINFDSLDDKSEVNLELDSQRSDTSGDDLLSDDNFK